jgi:hypothetical protein
MSRQYLFVCSDEREPQSMREDGQTGDHALNTSHKVGACAGGLAPVHICRASAVRVGVLPNASQTRGLRGPQTKAADVRIVRSHTSRSDSCVLQGTWGVGWSFISNYIYARAAQGQEAAFDWPELYSTAARRRCHLSSPTSRACQADSLSAVTPGTTPGHASRGQIFCIFAEDYRYDVIFARPLHLCQLAVVPRGERRALDPRSVCGFLRIDRRVASRRM